MALRQLWLSQVRVPDADKSTLLDAPISSGHTFELAVEEILQRSHREQEMSQQVAAMLPSHTKARRQRPAVTTVTRTPQGTTSRPPQQLKHGAVSKDGETPDVGN
ncbi:UNVERIFIED_CONTAM: hypothetical protein FKN15_068727 [Acipenser sinensis]